MRKFKKIDFRISVALIVSGIIASLLLKGGTFLISYFVVGAWQCFSMLIHIFTEFFTEKSGARNIYHWVTLISLVSVPFGGLWVLLFLAPFMAVFYTYLCYDEVYNKMARPLSQLR